MAHHYFSSGGMLKVASVTQNSDGTHQFVSESVFELVSGGSLPALTLVYETYGILNAARDNAILIPHALSTNSHIASHHLNTAPGWWENMVGQGKPIDTDHYFIICVNNLGSCFGSSGPSSVDPRTQAAYRMTFPTLRLRDIAESQHILLTHLGIDHCHAVVGASLGGMIALEFALAHPEHTRRLILVSSAARAYPAPVAIRSLQRDIIRLDPAWQNGQYQTRDLPGFIAARKLAHYTYRNPQALNARFLDNVETINRRTIQSYLEYNARKFVSGFDANSYLYLTEAMDNYDITRDATPPYSHLQKLRCPVLQISASSDILFTVEEQRELHQWLLQAGVASQHVEYETDYGHDAFLVETVGMGRYIKDFIEA